MKTIQLDIVSAQSTLYSGVAVHIHATSLEGSFEVRPGHSQLVAALKPAPLIATLKDGRTIDLFISGGIIEVQPDHVTVLADTAIRADDLDEQTALQAQAQAREQLANKTEQLDHSTALAELAAAAAQLRLLKARRSK